MKLAYLYDKRKKEMIKASYEIGYEVSRLEVKLQSRFFLDKEVSVRTFIEELKDYKLFYFKDMTQKEEFIKRYNKANSNKHRSQLIADLSMATPEIVTNMKNIEEFLRMVDTIKFDDKGKFFITPKENYIIGTSRFNTTSKR
jgi:glutaredoxin-related protein